MRLLILATSYPTPGNIYQQVFVRTRVQGYQARGVAVTVLNFKSGQDYTLDGVQVVTLQTAARCWENLRDHFDVVVSHAPNLRQHWRFLWPRVANLPPLVLTFHGHETLRINRHYPRPFPWLQGKLYPAKRLLQEVYDTLKLWVLEAGIERLLRNHGVKLLYVSQAMKEMAYRDLGVEDDRWAQHRTVIHNSIGAAFENARHDPVDPLGDFVTIRPIDVSKMAIDLVVECARQNPDKSFHVYGKGTALRHLDPPANLVHFDHFLENSEIPQLLNRYRAGLMPSLWDSQGVMMCEMASMGMPVVASNIPAHREMLQAFPKTLLLDNQTPVLDAAEFLARCEAITDEPSSVFHQEHTISQELALFQSLL